MPGVRACLNYPAVEGGMGALGKTATPFRRDGGRGSMRAGLWSAFTHEMHTATYLMRHPWHCFTLAHTQAAWGLAHLHSSGTCTRGWRLARAAWGLVLEARALQRCMPWNRPPARSLSLALFCVLLPCAGVGTAAGPLSCPAGLCSMVLGTAAAAARLGSGKGRSDHQRSSQKSLGR